jgi:hypothetical protein
MNMNKTDGPNLEMTSVACVVGQVLPRPQLIFPSKI